MIKKILFLGPAEAGKTSLRRFFFEGIPAGDLLKNAEPPTIGLKYSSYDYVYSFPTQVKSQKMEKIPLSLSVVDSAGQNLREWLDERRDRVFPGTDLVFYIFDVADWLDEKKRTDVEDNIMQIYNQRAELAPQATFFIIAHKFDKVPEGKSYRDQMKRRIKKELNEYVFDKMMKFLDFDIYITSLYEEYATDTFLTLVNLITDLAKGPM